VDAATDASPAHRVGFKAVVVGHTKAGRAGAPADTRPWAWTAESIQLFVDWTGAPIPAPVPTHFEYYLGVLDAWEGGGRHRAQAGALAACVQGCGGPSGFRKALQTVRRRATAHVEAHPEFRAFMAADTSVVVRDIAPGFTSKTDVYNPRYAGQTFLSLDVRTANFRMLKAQCPGLVGPDEEWADFLARVTREGPALPDDSPHAGEVASFLGSSRPFRVKFFGWLGATPKTQCHALRAVHAVHSQVVAKSPGAKQLTKIMCSADEVLYRVPTDFAVGALREAVEAHCPGTFHVRKFALRRINDLPSYMKVHLEAAAADTAPPRELKCVKRAHMIQCMNYLLEAPIAPQDSLEVTPDGVVQPAAAPSPFQVLEARRNDKRSRG